ncbi:MAG: hypothetical protein HOQ07_08415 [Sinomonas sp.]|nr:hypothetical protein [Sinomonas sp.]
MTDYDRDPEALAWARTHIQAYLDRLAEFEATAGKNRNAVMAYICGVARELTKKHFLGDGDGIIGVFDQRRPGPAADRNYDVEKAGDQP